MTALIVSATHAEAAHLPASLPLVVTGIGKVAAATAVAATLAWKDDITEVVNIGSAGALREGLDGLHEIGRVWNHDLSAEVLRSLGYDPQEWLQTGTSDIALATGDVFVTDPALRASLAREAHLVDMEGYAVAWAAQNAGLPVRLVKHVSDNADEGSLDWPALVDHSARELARWVAQNL
jgi:adenosylhomocysteine nucleosidase